MSVKNRQEEAFQLTESFLVQERSLVLLSAFASGEEELGAQPLLVLASFEQIGLLKSLLEDKNIFSSKSGVHFLIAGVPSQNQDFAQWSAKEIFLSLLDKLDSLYCTSLSGAEFLYAWYKFWRKVSCTSTVVHGTLINAYGMGVLLVGKSGIGKSEAAYALLRRGHRLVCDDAVRLVPSPYFKGRLLGMPAEPTLQGFMEIKGVGIVSVIAMYGVGVLQDFSRVDLVVELLEKGLEEGGSLYEVLGLTIPKVYLEIKGHQDWTSLLESVILNSKLSLLFNYNALQECASSQEEIIKRKSKDL